MYTRKPRTIFGDTQIVQESSSLRYDSMRSPLKINLPTECYSEVGLNHTHRYIKTWLRHLKKSLGSGDWVKHAV